MFALGGSAAGFTLIAAGTAALAIPVVGIVIGVSLIIFGSLMIYQAQKEQRQPPSLVGRTVEIPDQLPDQKKIEPLVTPSRVSVPSNIWQRRTMAMAAIVGIYGLMRLGSSYFSSDPTQPTPTGSGLGAYVGSPDTCASIPAEPVCPVGSSDPFSSLSIPGAVSARNNSCSTPYAYLKTHPFDPLLCILNVSFTRTAEFDNPCPSSDAVSVFSRQAASEEKRNLNGKGNCAIQPTNASEFSSSPAQTSPSNKESSVPEAGYVSSPSFPNLRTIAKITIGVLGVLGSAWVSTYSFWKTARHIAAGVFKFGRSKLTAVSPQQIHHQGVVGPPRIPPSGYLSRNQGFPPGSPLSVGGGSGGGRQISMDRNIRLDPLSRSPIETSARSGLPSNVWAIIQGSWSDLERTLVAAPVEPLPILSAENRMAPWQFTRVSGLENQRNDRFPRDLLAITFYLPQESGQQRGRMTRIIIDLGHFRNDAPRGTLLRRNNYPILVGSGASSSSFLGMEIPDHPMEGTREAQVIPHPGTEMNRLMLFFGGVLNTRRSNIPWRSDFLTNSAPALSHVQNSVLAPLQINDHRLEGRLTQVPDLDSASFNEVDPEPVVYSSSQNIRHVSSLEDEAARRRTEELSEDERLESNLEEGNGVGLRRRRQLASAMGEPVIVLHNENNQIADGLDAREGDALDLWLEGYEGPELEIVIDSRGIEPSEELRRREADQHSRIRRSCAAILLRLFRKFFTSV